MNKAELVGKVSESTGLQKSTAEVVVNTVFSTISDALAKGDSVSIAGFGNFTVKERAARKGRNPRTGEEISIPASRAPAFKAAKGLKDALG